MLVEILLFFFTLLLIAYIYITQKFHFFDAQSVPISTPSFPFGSKAAKNLMLGKTNFIDYGEVVAEEFPNAKMVGFFMFRQPKYFVRDEKIMKSIMIKDFEHFTDIPSFKTASKWSNNFLTNLSGDDWKRARSIMSNIFTGSSLKRMLPYITTVGERMEKHFIGVVANGNGEVDMKSRGADFALDAIASNGFGVENDSFNNPDSMFYKMAMRLTSSPGYEKHSPFVTAMKFILFSAWPTLAADVLKMEFLPKDAEDFFVDIIIKTYKKRLETGEKRGDLIGLIVEAIKDANAKKQTVKQNLETDFEKDQALNMDNVNVEEVDLETMLVANVLILFFAGFSTTSDGIAVISHAFAMHPEYQENAYEEIMDVFGGDPDAEITTDKLAELKYMDKFVLEALRYSDIFKGVERVCTKNYKVPDMDVVIEKGTYVYLYTHDIAFDKENHLNSREFDPENFEPGNVKNKFGNMSFGQGPRGCIGMRFALYMVKICMVYTLRKFKLSPGTGLHKKLKYNLDIVSGFQGGVPIKLTPRK